MTEISTRRPASRIAPAAGPELIASYSVLAALLLALPLFFLQVQGGPHPVVYWAAALFPIARLYWRLKPSAGAIPYDRHAAENTGQWFGIIVSFAGSCLAMAALTAAARLWLDPDARLPWLSEEAFWLYGYAPALLLAIAFYRNLPPPWWWWCRYYAGMFGILATVGFAWLGPIVVLALTLEPSEHRLYLPYHAVYLALYIVSAFALFAAVDRWIASFRRRMRDDPLGQHAAASLAPYERFRELREHALGRLGDDEQVRSYYFVPHIRVRSAPLALACEMAFIAAFALFLLYPILMAPLYGAAAAFTFWLVYPVLVAASILHRPHCLFASLWTFELALLPLALAALVPGTFTLPAALGVAAFGCSLGLLESHRRGNGWIVVVTDRRFFTYRLGFLGGYTSFAGSIEPDEQVLQHAAFQELDAAGRPIESIQDEAGPRRELMPHLVPFLLASAATAWLAYDGLNRQLAVQLDLLPAAFTLGKGLPEEVQTASRLTLLAAPEDPIALGFMGQASVVQGDYDAAWLLGHRALIASRDLAPALAPSLAVELIRTVHYRRELIELLRADHGEAESRGASRDHWVAGKMGIILLDQAVRTPEKTAPLCRESLAWLDRASESAPPSPTVQYTRARAADLLAFELERSAGSAGSRGPVARRKLQEAAARMRRTALAAYEATARMLESPPDSSGWEERDWLGSPPAFEQVMERLLDTGFGQSAATGRRLLGDLGTGWVTAPLRPFVLRVAAWLGDAGKLDDLRAIRGRIGPEAVSDAVRLLDRLGSASTLPPEQERGLRLLAGVR